MYFIPRKLLIHNELLFSLNNDSSITIWNKKNGDKILDFYIFSDLNWLVFFKSDQFYGSNHADGYVSVFKDGSTSAEDSSKYFTK